MVWETFRIPLAKIRVVVKSEGDVLLSDISHLPLEDLNDKEIHFLADRLRWER